MASKTATHPPSPYLAARAEWNERYGDYIASARRWRFVALGSSLLTLFAVYGLIHVSAQSKLVPYVVEVDKLGQTRGAKPAEKAGPADPRVIKAMLAAFITDWRSVGVDVAVQRRAIDHVYTYLPPNEAATNAVTEQYAKANPFDRAATETVTVQLISVLPLSERTWQLEWIETTRSRRGQITGTTRWKTAATVALQPPATEQDILRNPIGLFITDLQWSQDLN